LVLAAGVLLAQLASAARERPEAQQAVVCLICEGHEPWVVHVWVCCVDRIHVVAEETLLPSGRHLSFQASKPALGLLLPQVENSAAGRDDATLLSSSPLSSSSSWFSVPVL